jgi:hypothetical protein
VLSRTGSKLKVKHHSHVTVTGIVMLAEVSIQYSIISNFYRLLLHQNRNLETASFLLSVFFTSHNVTAVPFFSFSCLSHQFSYFTTLHSILELFNVNAMSTEYKINI